jgi:hypothetical protein
VLVAPQQVASKGSHQDYQLQELHRQVPRTDQQQEENRARCALVWVGTLCNSLHHLCARLVNDSDFQEAAAASLMTASSEDAWRSLPSSEQEQQQLQRAVEVWCPPDCLCSSI